MKAVTFLLVFGLLASAALAVDSPIKEEMRFKLMYSQGILEGIATENFELIATNAFKMKHFSQRPVWDVRQAPEYRRLTLDFQRNLTALSRAAEQRNVDSATVAYFQLTVSCVTCHKYLRGAEVSSLGKPTSEQVQLLAEAGLAPTQSQKMDSKKQQKGSSESQAPLR